MKLNLLIQRQATNQLKIYSIHLNVKFVFAYFCKNYQKNLGRSYIGSYIKKFCFTQIPGGKEWVLAAITFYPSFEQEWNEKN